MSSTPTIVIVPGSFAPAFFYDDVVKGLKANGFDTLVYDLPTASRKPPEHAATMYEDAMYFNGILTAMCDAGKDVVVLGHSYGGCVASECVKGLTEERTGKGRVVGLIYLAALVPKVGEALGALTAHLGFDFIKVDGDFMYHEPLENSARTNFSDLPQDKALEIVKQMPYHSGISFQNELQYAGYKDVDGIAYILCSQDKCLPPDLQKQMMENAKSGGKPVKVYQLDSGHCPNSSQPQQVVETIEEIMRGQFIK